MANTGYYKNLGTGVVSTLNGFDAGIAKANEIVKQRVANGELDGTDASIQDGMNDAIFDVYENGGFGDMSIEEIEQRVGNTDFAAQGMDYDQQGDRKAMNDIISQPAGSDPQDQDIRRMLQSDLKSRMRGMPNPSSNQSQLRGYAADPDGVADAEMPPQQYQQMMGVRNNMVNGQDPQTDPRLRADLRSQLVANMRGVKR